MSLVLGQHSDLEHALLCIPQLKRLSTYVLLSAILTFASATCANSATYNALTDYSAANPSGAWTYGQGTLGSSFTPFTVFSPNNCFGFSGFSCWQPPVTTLFTPDVALNTTGSAFWGTTFLAPENALHIHPGVSSDVILQWRAPASGTYNISGFFELLDASPTGIVGEIYNGSDQLFTGTLTGPPASRAALMPGGSESFSLIENLTAGSIIEFGVNNAGNFLFDSTGFNATITSAATAPEPGSLLLVGLGTIALGHCKRLKTRYRP